ncbi:glycosyltransferase [Rhodobacterales bacterium HKCCSP123]|nr:glycosyltransferase [Rhodobacterales bacterium HKCCSP123]
MKILHVASWYPNPWDDIEGNFVRDQISLFKKEFPADVVVVQVRPKFGCWPRFSRCNLEGGARGYVLHAPVRSGSKLLEWLSTLLLLSALVREGAWRFDAFHFHIAYPLLIHVRFWRWVFRRDILISEHWSAYHYKFNLREDSRALGHMRRPFQQGFPVFAVSWALLEDIQNFAKRDDFKGFVLPNVVPLHGAARMQGEAPVLFAVNRWVSVKNPMPMLDGLHRAAEAGQSFTLVLGGYGDLIEEMKAFVETSALRERTRFTGKLTKPEIAELLSKSDGYLFSSDYETFSIACAEALGAGVPLIGPHISAIAEYAGSSDWLEVSSRTPQAWEDAIRTFLSTWARGGWNREAIAFRATQRFSESRLRADYRAAMLSLGLDDDK